MNRLQKKLLIFFTFIGGAYFFLEFVLPKEIGGVKFGAYHDQILRGIQIVGVMAIGLGILSIFRVHGGNIVRRSPGMWNSAALLAGFITMLAFQSNVVSQEQDISSLQKKFEGIIKFIPVALKDPNPGDKLSIIQDSLSSMEKRADAELGLDTARDKLFSDSKANVEALRTNGTDEKPAASSLRELSSALANAYGEKYQNSLSKKGESLLNNGLFIPLGSAMFSLLAFYIASAAYRSFRVRSLESSLLMLTAVIVMLGQIPQGSLYISESLPAIRLWLLKNISTPAFRAIFFGASIAGLAMAIRIWLSLEQSPFSDEER